MIQLSETELPTLHESVRVSFNLKAQVEALPSKAEQGVDHTTHPNPLVLHPAKKALHSSFVLAVVLREHYLSIQKSGAAVSVAMDQHEVVPLRPLSVLH